MNYLSLLTTKERYYYRKEVKIKITDPGKYDIASSGHMGKGEPYEAAAAREMMEEIGISSELTLVKKMIVYFPEETEYDAIFKTQHNGPFTVSKREIDEVKFVTESELRKRIANLTIFAQEALKSVGVL